MFMTCVLSISDRHVPAMTPIPKRMDVISRRPPTPSSPISPWARCPATCDFHVEWSNYKDMVKLCRRLYIMGPTSWSSRMLSKVLPFTFFSLVHKAQGDMLRYE